MIMIILTEQFRVSGKKLVFFSCIWISDFNFDIVSIDPYVDG